MLDMTTTDPVILNQWHPLSSLEEMTAEKVYTTRLLDMAVSYGVDQQGTLSAWPSDDALKAGAAFNTASLQNPLPVKHAHGYLWTCLGEPPDTLFSFDEYHEADRQCVATGVFGVNVSAGRAVENFLDMGHFPFVHTGILGEEPHTEVKEYQVEVSETRDEVVATKCQFYQPQAALASEGGEIVDYIYRVPHVNCALLYKSSPIDESRMDVIYLFLQPTGQEQVRAHTGMCVIDEENPRESIRYFQQTIFGQDKPILENQFPRRLPLDPRAETPIRADKTAIAFRRWLSSKGLTYGVIPVAS
jgi:phenylpropionate dioxygenase-like ring-hydroxylating dioxygenase large terminal subunit